MKRKLIGFLVVIAMMAVVVPASADTSAGAHVGVFQAKADVGKTGSCNDQGEGTVSGGGIGFVPTPAKNAYWRIFDGIVTDFPAGSGEAQLCGQLTAPLQDTPLDVKSLGIGASCLSTKGWGGYGKAGFPDLTSPGSFVINISNLGWKVTLGGTFLVTGDASSGADKTKKEDLLVAAVQALSQGVVEGCLFKTLGDKSDPDFFDVVAAYTIIPGAGGNTPKKDPKKP